MAVVVIGVVLAVSAAVFLLGGLILITRIIRRKPLLVISDEGVTTDDFFAGVGFVRWDELRGVGERCIGRSSPLLAIDARHPDLIIERQRSPLKRASLRYNIRHGGGIVNIAEGMIAMDHGELLAAIAERIDHSRHRPDGRGRKRR